MNDTLSQFFFVSEWIAHMMIKHFWGNLVGDPEYENFILMSVWSLGTNPIFMEVVKYLFIEV